MDWFVFDAKYLLIGLVEIFSHFVQGCTGFGATVIQAPIATGILGSDVGTCFGTLITMPLLYVLAALQWKEISWKDLLKICALMAPGMIVGNMIFGFLPAQIAKVCIGGIVTCIALKNIYNAFIRDPKRIKEGWDPESEEEIAKANSTGMKIFRYGCLLLGGCVHGAFNIGGPLITVYTLYSVKDKTKFRATMTMVWVIMNTCFNIVAQYSAGRYETPILWSALLVCVPLAAVGFYLGHIFHTKINRDIFLKFVYAALLIVGGDMFIRNVIALLG